jgi:hypothetical protein
MNNTNSTMFTGMLSIGKPIHATPILTGVDIYTKRYFKIDAPIPDVLQTVSADQSTAQGVDRRGERVKGLVIREEQMSSVGEDDEQHSEEDGDGGDVARRPGERLRHAVEAPEEAEEAQGLQEVEEEADAEEGPQHLVAGGMSEVRLSHAIVPPFHL